MISEPKRVMRQDQIKVAFTPGGGPMSVCLMNGIKLQGQIESGDQYGLSLSGSSL
jgi:sRNA-binding regulator protein Hfq